MHECMINSIVKASLTAVFLSLCMLILLLRAKHASHICKFIWIRHSAARTILGCLITAYHGLLHLNIILSLNKEQKKLQCEDHLHAVIHLWSWGISACCCLWSRRIWARPAQPEGFSSAQILWCWRSAVAEPTALACPEKQQDKRNGIE